jgi:hypothetical protein
VVVYTTFEAGHQWAWRWDSVHRTAGTARVNLFALLPHKNHFVAHQASCNTGSSWRRSARHLRSPSFSGAGNYSATASSFKTTRRLDD